MNTQKFRIRSGLKIGAATAEEDGAYLPHCFIDTGLLNRLRDIEDGGCIVLGRTGSGKTALARKLQMEEDNVIELDAESLSFNYVANSDILKFVSSIGVNLDLFFKLLWQHILAVEILRQQYHIDCEEKQNNVLSQFFDFFKGNSKKRAALDYLQKYGSEFWLETGVRARELTERFEQELGGSVGATMQFAKASLADQNKMTLEQKEEVLQRAQNVVNSVQIGELSNVINFLAEDVFRDRQKKLYVIIDRLDENWVGDDVKYKLIRSLVESIKKFRHVRGLKIVLCIRSDLLERVIIETKELGFQSEKYEDYYIKIKWTQPKIHALMDSRIDQLIRETYTKQSVVLDKLFPTHIGGDPIATYIFQRTFLRPRDAIIFVNTVLEKATDKMEISSALIREAEVVYSRGRLRSLIEEWISVHPKLETALKFLTRWQDGSRFQEISVRTLQDTAYELVGSESPTKDPLVTSAEALAERSGQRHQDFARVLLSILYKVGAVGLKVQTHRPTIWSQSDQSRLEVSEIGDDSKIYVHKALHSALGVILPK